MSIGLIIVIIAAVLIAAALAVVVRAELTKRRLRTSFGPEYDRAVVDAGGRKAAGKELARRQTAHHRLRPEPISAADREYYTTSWGHVQGSFLDDPASALGSAEQLIARLLDARGYPADDETEQLALLSVLHGDTLAAFREARETGRQAIAAPADTSTEAMRTALVKYHVLFDGLLTEPGATVQAASNQNTEIRT